LNIIRVIKFKKDEMGRVFNIRERKEGWKPERNYWGDLDVDGNMKLKWIINK
jgi:hypothetical protein